MPWELATMQPFTIAALVICVACLFASADAFETISPGPMIASSLRPSCYPASSTRLFLAKAAKKNKPNAKKGSGGGGLKGFGGVSSPSKSSDVDIDRSPQARKFYDFLEQNSAGENLNRCALGYFPLNDDDNNVKLRGMVALKDVKKGDNLISIPIELAINLGQEGADPTVPALQFLKEYCHVLGDENADPGKRAYFEMLPEFGGDDCMGSTDFFSEEALGALQSPLIVEETKKRREQTKARFESGVDDSFPAWIDGTPVTVPHLQWAVWLITSRVLTVQGVEDEGKSYRLLIPFLDMCNHDRSSSHVLTGRAVSGGQLKVVAGAGVKKGEQINICYGGGMAGNDRFIQDYGFLDVSNNSVAYIMVAQQLVGKRRILEGVGSGRFMAQSDMDRTLEELRSTTIDQDKALLESTSDVQIRAAYRYRLGVKEALSKFIMMQ